VTKRKSEVFENSGQQGMNMDLPLTFKNKWRRLTSNPQVRQAALGGSRVGADTLVGWLQDRFCLLKCRWEGPAEIQA
jgi:hypothetical protein